MVSGSSAGKESTCKNLPGLIPGSRSSPGEGLGYPFHYSWASLVAQMVKRVCLQCRRPGFNSWVGKIPWRRAWQPTPVFLPGECSLTEELAGYSPWGRKESDMTERLKHSTQHWSPNCRHTALTNSDNQHIRQGILRPMFSCLLNLES